MAATGRKPPVVPAADYPDRTVRLGARFRRWYEFASFPLTVYVLFNDRQIQKEEYSLTWLRVYRLAWRMFRNSRRVTTATQYQAHLVMAVKLLQLPRRIEGVVVECGCFKGGSAVNLSLVCDMVGRELIVYDSFEGLPESEPDDKYAKPSYTGWFRGDLDEVKANITEFGVIDRCVFRKGWFKDTLPPHKEPIVACFIDVDFQSSLRDCIINLWPKVTRTGYVFMDEYTRLDYCALFYSEKFWKKHFGVTPPGLFGIGSGVPVGNFFVGPMWSQPPWQYPSSIAYTRKHWNGHWNYYPDERDERSSTLDAVGDG